MGNCLKKRQKTLQATQMCSKCNRLFPPGTPIIEVFTLQKQFSQHANNCELSILHHPPPQQHPLHEVHIEIMQPIPLPPIDQNRQPRPALGQFIMDDFRNNKQKHYWAKELLPGSKIKYLWTKKPIPPLPVKSVQEMLSLPWNQVKGAEFPTKQTWFRLQMEKLRISWQQGSDTLHVSKDSFLMTTLNMCKEINWHKEVKVQIEGDKVLDAGGLLREWASLIMKEIVHPESGMFQIADCEDVSYKINNEADIDEHIIDCFKLLGTVVGKCIFERIPLNVYFDRSILKHMLGQSIALEDIYFYDRPLYQSWDYITSNKFDANDLSEYFVIYRRQKKDYFELKPDGQTTLVDMDNSQEYVNLCIDYYTYISVKPFLTAFLNQLYSIIPKKILSVFEPLELEMILYGIPFIDLKDWKENSEYKGAYYRTHQIVIWFWDVLEELDQPTLAKFLQFCTGSQRTPVEGFRKLESNRGNCSKFCIESVAFSLQNPFPKAHTCFNRLELPLYETKEDTQLYVKAVVNADMEGQFGLE